MLAKTFPVKGIELPSSIAVQNELTERDALLDWDLEDRALILRLQNGDNLALNEIMDRYQGLLHSYAYRFVGDANEAADLVQETFVRVFLKRAKYKPKGKFKTWIYTITGNLCRDWIRRRKRQPLQYVEEIFDSQMTENKEHGQPISAGDNPIELVSLKEEANLLKSAIGQLPTKLKQVVILYLLEGHSQEETGELLGCSAKAVETRVYRAKRLLKKACQSVGS